jgi:peroxiredoxin
MTSNSTLSRSVLCVLACSLALNCLLTLRLDHLRPKPPKAGGAIAPGKAVPPISARTLAGNPAKITYDSGRPTLIYVFKPECSWCLKNVDSIRALASAVRDRYHVVGVSLTTAGLEDYVREHAFPFEVYRDVDRDTQKAYEMGATPQTIVVSANGRVVKDWLGSYSGQNLTMLRAFFGVSLPPAAAPGRS